MTKMTTRTAMTATATAADEMPIIRPAFFFFFCFSAAMRSSSAFFRSSISPKPEMTSQSSRSAASAFSVFASFFYLIYTPYNIMALSYDSMGVELVTLGGVLLATANYDKKLQLIFSGLCFCFG